MARRLRVFIQDTPIHIILKSIDSISLFKDNNDSDFFLKIIETLNMKNDLDIHSYAIFQTYFEFLATPLNMEVMPKFMQSLGRQYVLYYNKKYNRTGTLWDGRYKSSLVEAKNYLFDVMCHIEQKKNSLYSSKNKNLFNTKNLIVKNHTLYKQLGTTQKDRINSYEKIFLNFDYTKSNMIEESLEKQIVTGSEQYIKTLEKKLGVLLSTKQRGRPKKESVTAETKIYKNLQILDKRKHQKLKLNAISNFNFAKTSHVIPVSIQEVALIGLSFPIVFTADTTCSLIALVSLGTDNLAIDDEGQWISKDIPNFLKKYPFSLASSKDNVEQKIILIDEDSNLFSKSKGKQLFKKSGEQSASLQNAIQLLTTYEQQMITSKNTIKEIVNSGILEDKNISVGEAHEKKILIDKFKVVNKEKLHALSDDIFTSWQDKGIITFIDAHLKSLDNIQTLFDLISQKQK